MTISSEWFVIGGFLQLSVLAASALVPHVLDWRGQLRRLSPLFAQLVWVHGGYIVLMIVGLGSMSIVNATELAARTTLARSFCAFTTLFWGARLGLQFWYFRPQEYLATRTLRWGYRALTVVFIGLTAIYAWGTCW